MYLVNHISFSLTYTENDLINFFYLSNWHLMMLTNTVPTLSLRILSGKWWCNCPWKYLHIQNTQNIFNPKNLGLIFCYGMNKEINRIILVHTLGVENSNLWEGFILPNIIAFPRVFDYDVIGNHLGSNSDFFRSFITRGFGNSLDQCVTWQFSIGQSDMGSSNVGKL